MKCPKCGKNDGVRDFMHYHHCSRCEIAWTDWQQSKIEELEKGESMIKLIEVEKRYQMATKGPWITTKTNNSVSVASHSEHNRIYISLRDPICLPETFARQKDDADFIAHSRTDLPEAVRLLRKAREIIERYRIHGVDVIIGEVDPLADAWMEEVQE